MAVIFLILRSITNLVLGICFLYLFCFVAAIIHGKSIRYGIDEFDYFVNKELGKVKRIAIPIISLCVVLTFIGNSGIQQLIGLDNILLKPEGDYCFFIKINNDYYPALIHISSDEEEYGYYGEKKKTKYYYSLKEAVLWDEKVHEFSPNDNLLALDNSEYVFSEDGIEFYCTLVNKHAYSPLIKETNDINILNFSFLGLKEVSYIIVIIALAKRYKKSQDENQAEHYI